MQEAEIYLYDNLTLFYPVTEGIDKTLTIWEREIARGEITSTPKKLYAREIRNGKEIGITYQGFWQRIIQHYLKDGYIYKLHDERICRHGMALPRPAYDKMYGFRFSQGELLTTAIKADRSGLIGAPTRWGKTRLIINYLRAFPHVTSCVVAPGVDLVNQLYVDLTCESGLTDRKVHLVHGARKLKAPLKEGDIVVCSVDSLSKINPEDFQLLLADEPHALVTEDRLKLIDAFKDARRIGFGATLKGRFDGRDKLIEGVFGPVIVERTYKEAVTEGAICPLNILFLDIELTPRFYYNRQQAYDGLLFKNQQIARIISDICKNIIPEDFQTLIFVKHEKQADLLQDVIGRDTTIAMAKKMTTKEREEITEKMRSNIIKRCLCTKIYVQGVTFSDVRVLINAEAGGNNTSAIQKPGRLAEIRPGKKCGIIIDFFFKEAPDSEDNPHTGTTWKALIADSRNRKKAYSEKGYTIEHCSNLEELSTKFKNLI